MGAIIILIVVGTSFWVFFDSMALNIPIHYEKKTSFWNGYGCYFVMCLLCWIVIFPMYLVNRARILRARASNISVNPVLSKEQEMKTAKFFKVDVNTPKHICPHCGYSNYVTLIYCFNCAREIG